MWSSERYDGCSAGWKEEYCKPLQLASAVALFTEALVMRKQHADPAHLSKFAGPVGV